MLMRYSNSSLHTPHGGQPLTHSLSESFFKEADKIFNPLDVNFASKVPTTKKLGCQGLSFHHKIQKEYFWNGPKYFINCKKRQGKLLTFVILLAPKLNQDFVCLYDLNQSQAEFSFR